MSELVRFTRFVCVGALNTLVTLATIYLCKWLMGMGDVMANLLGYAIGLANSFALNRQWTFNHAGSMASALGPFILVFLIAYLLNLGTVLLAIDVLGANGFIAHAIGALPYTVFFYAGTRWFVFRPSGP